MKLVMPDPISFQSNHPVNRRNRCVRALEGTPGGPGPIQPREVTHPGNVSMYDHLQQTRSQAIADLEPDIVWG